MLYISNFKFFEFISSVTNDNEFGNWLPNAIVATNCPTRMKSMRQDSELVFSLDTAKIIDLKIMKMLHCFRGLLKIRSI